MVSMPAVTPILIGAIFLGANSIRMHYSWSADVNNAHSAFNKVNETNRNLALKYHKNRSEREKGLREHIEKLNSENEQLKRAKEGMRKRIQEFSTTINNLVNEQHKNRRSYLLARETNLICVGVAKDDAQMLKQAEVIQEQRTGKPFDIKEWHNMSVLAEVIIKLNSGNVSKWITSKDGWRDVINKDLHSYINNLALTAKPKPIIINIDGVNVDD